MSNDAQIAAYKSSVKQAGEDLLVRGFPATILTLNSLLDTAAFRKRNLGDIHSRCLPEGCDAPPPAKRHRVEREPDASAPAAHFRSNRFLVALIEQVKPHMVKLVEDAKMMKMWVAFMVPKIEDGNNFGVEIQEETLMLVQGVETTAKLFYNRITNYFMDRARVIQKLEKYPEIEDLRRAVQELDEKEYCGFCMDFTEIRNQYCALHDIFMKNMDKIKKPRSYLSSETLY